MLIRSTKQCFVDCQFHTQNHFEKVKGKFNGTRKWRESKYTEKSSACASKSSTPATGEKSQKARESEKSIVTIQLNPTETNTTKSFSTSLTMSLIQKSGKDDSNDAVVIGSVQNGSIIISHSRIKQKSDAVLEREAQMKTLKQQYPQVDSMTIHDVLSKVNFNLENAQKELKKLKITRSGPLNRTVTKPVTVQASTSKVPQQTSTTEIVPKTLGPGVKTIVLKAEHPIKTEPIEEDVVFVKQEPLEEFYSHEELTEESKLLKFFQCATYEELRFLGSSADKGKEIAQFIVSSRPFNNWLDLINKLETNPFGTDLTKTAQQLFDIQGDIDALLQKGKLISEQVDEAVKRGAGIMEQPAMLAPSVHLNHEEIENLDWLMVMHLQGVHGIVVDDKGEGRMVQVIAFLAHLKEQGMAIVDLPHLVIVPSNILDNWKHAFKTYCPDLNVFVYHGDKEQRIAHRMKWYRGELLKYDIILTTYTVVIHIAEEKDVFNTLQTHYIVFDETHVAKNINTQLYDNLIKAKAKRKLLLTQSSLQDNPLELMSVLNFSIPSTLSGVTDHSKSLFQKALRGSQKALEFTSFERKVIEQVKMLLQPFILHKLKPRPLRRQPITPCIEVRPYIPWQNEFIEFVSPGGGVNERYKIPVECFEGLPQEEMLNQLCTVTSVPLRRIDEKDDSTAKPFLFNEEEDKTGYGLLKVNGVAPLYGRRDTSRRRKRKRYTDLTDLQYEDDDDDEDWVASTGRSKSANRSCGCSDDITHRNRCLGGVNADTIATRRGRRKVNSSRSESESEVQPSVSQDVQSSSEVFVDLPMVRVKEEDFTGFEEVQSFHMNGDTAPYEEVVQPLPVVIKTEVELGNEAELMREGELEMPFVKIERPDDSTESFF